MVIVLETRDLDLGMDLSKLFWGAAEFQQSEKFEMDSKKGI